MSNKILKLCNVVINAKGFKLLFWNIAEMMMMVVRWCQYLHLNFNRALDRIFANLFFKVKLLAHILEND